MCAMLKTENKLYKTILIVFLVLIAAGLAVSAQAVVNEESDAWTRISGAFIMFALISAGHYLLEGYAKNAASYFKAFLALFSAALFTSMIAIAVTSTNGFPILLCGLAFGVVLALLLSKDLGRKYSFILCAAVIVCTLASLVYSIVRVLNGAIVGKVLPTTVIGSNASRLILACVLGVMMYAKYLNKAERGSK